MDIPKGNSWKIDLGPNETVTKKMKVINHTKPTSFSYKIST